MADKRAVGPVTRSSTVGAALALLVAFALQEVTGVELPETVTAALGVVFIAAGGLVGGWIPKPVSTPERGSGKHVAEEV